MSWTPTSALAHAVYEAGFEYDPAQDIIFSRMDPLQRNFGYAYGYDLAALGMSADIDCEPIFFDYAGKHWMIELWKGQYGLETGCEIGVYTRPIGSTGPGYALADATIGRRPGDATPSHNLFYDCAANADRLELTATLRRDGQALFTRGPETHWWLTGFKWGVLSTPGQLSMDVAIKLKDVPMRDAFMAGIAGRAYTNLQVNGTTVSFTFDQTFAVPQPPKPAAILSAIRADNQAIVDTYNSFNFSSNDPNVVQADFLGVVGLGLLRLADYYGRAASQLAIELGRDISSVVAALTDAFGVAAGTVEEWLGGVSQAFATWVHDVEQYLGLGLDFSCYVEVDNTSGASDLLLTGQTAASGTYVLGPPEWIPKGTVGRLVLRDPKPSVFGSEGTVTYEYCDASFAMKTVVFSFACPTGFNPNLAASDQAAWKCFAKSGDPNAGVEHHGARRRAPALRRLQDERPAAPARPRQGRHAGAAVRRQDRRRVPSGGVLVAPLRRQRRRGPAPRRLPLRRGRRGRADEQDPRRQRPGRRVPAHEGGRQRAEQPRPVAEVLTFHAAALSRLDGGNADGVHLLFEAPPQAGYSIDGFDIQRRPADRERKTECVSLSADELATLDEQLAVTYAYGLVELRTGPCPVPPRKPPDRPPGPRRTCVGFDRRRPRSSGPNPLELDDVTFTVFDGPRRQAGKTTFVKAGGGIGLDGGAGLQIDLPEDAESVELLLVAENGATVQATAEERRVSRKVRAGPEPQTIELRAGGLRRIRVTAADRGLALVSLCWTVTAAAEAPAARAAEPGAPLGRRRSPPPDRPAAA